MRLLIIIVAVVSFTACLPDALLEKKIDTAIKESSLTIDDVLFDQNAEMLSFVWLLRSGHDFLSETAMANLKKFINARSTLRKGMMGICGVAPSLSVKDKATVSSIKSDSALDNSEKKSRIKALLNDRMQKNSNVISTCRSERKDELAPYFTQRESLKSSCLIIFKPDQEIAGLPTKKARAWQRVKTLTNEEKAALNKKLESRECNDALGGYVS